MHEFCRRRNRINVQELTILTFIPAWKRRHITRLCFDGLKRVQAAAPKALTFHTLITVSNDEDEALAHKYGFDTCRTDNKPVGRKFNTGMLHALENYTFDYAMQLNSDDILSTDFWKLFEIPLTNTMHFFGVDRVYFYDSETGDIREFLYSLGCGIRFIRRDVIEESGFVDDCFELWPDEANAGLDMKSEDNINQRGNYGQFLIRNKAVQRPVVVDIKSAINIHPFNEFKHAKRLSDAHRADVLRRFPELKELEYAKHTKETASKKLHG